MSVTSRENAPGFLNNKIIVYLANIKNGHWVYTGISWDFGPGEAQPRG